MPHEYPPKQIAIRGESTFKVSGYGRSRPGLCFAYNDEECLVYEENGDFFRQGFRLALISGTDGNKTKVGDRLPELSCTLINKEGVDRTYKTNYPVKPRGIEPEDLLFIGDGEPTPTDPSQDEIKGGHAAIQQHDSRYLYTIDPIKVLDLVSFSIGSWIEFDRMQLREELRKNGRLGYVLGSTTMLLDLACDDFECIFEGGYLPTGITCDPDAGQHRIRFECPGRQLEIRGNARFIPTPSEILELYRGEISNRLNMRSLNNSDNPSDMETGTDTPDTRTDNAASEKASSEEPDWQKRLRNLLESKNVSSDNGFTKFDWECVLVGAMTSKCNHKYKYRKALAEWIFNDETKEVKDLKIFENRVYQLRENKIQNGSDKWEKICSTKTAEEIRKIVAEHGDFFSVP